MINNESTKYFDLTISQILALAESDDLDQTELASRLTRRLALEVRQRVAALTEAETVELANLAEVTNSEKAKAIARRFYWGCD
jgi:hypothetical protein